MLLEENDDIEMVPVDSKGYYDSIYSTVYVQNPTEAETGNESIELEKSLYENLEIPIKKS